MVEKKISIATLPRPAGEKEVLILDAAERLFAAYGPAKVTMDEIAADVGMGKASLYYYFPTKEDLFRSVIRREQLRFLAAMQEILETDAPAADKLGLYVTQRHHYFRQLLNLQIVCMSQWLTPKANFVEMFESFATEELALLTGIFVEGLRSGEFVAIRPDSLARLTLHVLQGLRLREVRAVHLSRMLGGENSDLEADGAAFVDSLLLGIVRTHAPIESTQKIPG